MCVITFCLIRSMTQKADRISRHQDWTSPLFCHIYFLSTLLLFNFACKSNANSSGSHMLKQFHCWLITHFVSDLCLTKRAVHVLVFTQDVEYIQLMQYMVKHHLCYDSQIFTFKCEVLHLLFIQYISLSWIIISIQKQAYLNLSESYNLKNSSSIFNHSNLMF